MAAATSTETFRLDSGTRWHPPARCAYNLEQFRPYARVPGADNRMVYIEGVRPLFSELS